MTSSVQQATSRPINTPTSTELRWVSITDPSQPFDKDTMRDNRVHVMRTYLQKGLRRPGGKDPQVRHDGRVDKRRKSRDAHSGASSLLRKSRARDPELLISSSASAGVGDGDGMARSAPRTQSSHIGQGGFSDFPHDSHETLTSSCEATQLDSRARADSLMLPLADASSQKLNFAVQLFDVRDGRLAQRSHSDPFGSMPRFEHPEIDVEHLRHQCIHHFGNCTIKRRWIPILSMTHETYLSSLCLPAAYLDAMQATGAMTSTKIRAVFEEVIRLINKNLNHEETRTSDATIVTVLHLLSAELMLANDSVLQLHEQGLWTMVAQRGGLDRLGGGGWTVAAMVVIISCQLAVFHESQPRPEYLMHIERVKASVAGSPFDIHTPESPLFLPFGDFLIVRRSSSCTPRTLEILRLAKNLTDAAVELQEARVAQQTPDLIATPKSRGTGIRASRSRLYATVYKIFASARDDEDAIYEAVRLCARLSASAIWYEIPLSVAARPPRPEDKVQHVFGGFTPLRMKQVLAQTDMFSCWGDMVGVLLWIALVSGAACNKVGQVSDESGSDARQRYEAETTRKWLIAIAMRCSILLLEDKTVVMMALSKLLAIQNLLSTTMTL
ncbi:hypothetical protein AAFC00_005415 [Neodothiora populina]